MTASPTRVLIVEDDPMVMELHRRFVKSVDGFEVVGVAQNGASAAEAIQRLRPQLVILDVYMPEMDGLTLLKQLRLREYNADVILVTAAQESRSVFEALRLGVVDYIIKPFRFERLRQALENYRQRREQLTGADVVNQATIDTLISRASSTYHPPKGLNRHTLELITDFLRERPGQPFSAEDVAQSLDISRVTARRYLEHLVEMGFVEQSMAYKAVGRPSNLFCWSGN